MFLQVLRDYKESFLFRCILACLSGGMYVLSFYPLCFWWLTPICIVVLYSSFVTASSLKLSVLVFFTFCISVMLSASLWIVDAMHSFTGVPSVWLMISVCLFFSFVIILFLPGFVLSFTLDHSPLAFAASFAVSEYLRSHYAVGGTWFSFGYSQTPPSPLSVWAPILGMNGINFIMIFFCASFYRVVFRREAIFPRSILFFIFILLSMFLRGVSWTHKIAGSSHNVLLVQPNLPVSSISDDIPLTIFKVILRYQLLMNNFSSADWVVFPEAGIPFTVDEPSDVFWSKLVKRLFRNFNRAPYLISGVHQRVDGLYYNSMVLVNPSGCVDRVYRKFFLLPLGEYQWPWLRLFLNPWVSKIRSYSSGDDHQPPMFLDKEAIAGNICYENAFSDYVRDRGEAATILLTMSNDAWFGRSAAPHMHFQVGQMRSLENGRPTLFISNSGPTGYIGVDGNAKSLPLFQAAVLETVVSGYSGKTPFQRFHGDTGVLIASLVCLSVLSIKKLRRQPLPFINSRNLSDSSFSAVTSEFCDREDDE
ncbi:apolipoprotein N-acyltransferase [Candidatus Ichthyocystis sparus]|uniref:apolipoprotein N-acyltransferase n=1 Tax=Candidatus Ichthyocystis sparus TaxID=1561004 RepID=UPI000AD6F8DF|nr:apolipoprotein N-acyltransferase [Candidatus Ichthyocystis sparus]